MGVMYENTRLRSIAALHTDREESSMPLNNQNYRDMVDNVAEGLPGVWQRIGNRQVKQLPVAAPPPVRYTLQFPPGDDRQGFQIIYRRNDAYILGFCTAGNNTYACANQVGAVAGAQSLGYNDTYADLGWNRQAAVVNRGGGPRVTVPLLDFALTRANNGNARREDMLCLVIALAEGVRFMDVERAVRGELPITTQMVDWGQQLAANQAVLRQG